MMSIEARGWNSIVRITCLILAFGLFSCAEEESIPPENLISEADMVEILIDLNLIESVRSMHITQEKTDKVPTEEFYNSLWEKKGINKERFLESFDYYRSDAQRMSDIYQQVADKIKRKEDELNERSRQEKQEQAQE